MIEAPDLTPEYYREKALEIRRFASRARSAEVRIELFAIAALFERMAERVARRARAAADSGLAVLRSIRPVGNSMARDGSVPNRWGEVGHQGERELSAVMRWRGPGPAVRVPTASARAADSPAVRRGVLSPADPVRERCGGEASPTLVNRGRER